jgi:Mn-containing catalase
MDTGTEEIAHIEMLATAVSLNLQGASSSVIDTIVGNNPIMKQIVGEWTHGIFYQGEWEPWRPMPTGFPSMAPGL